MKHPVPSVLQFVVVALIAALTLPCAASAAQRLEIFPLPSLQGNVDPAKVKLNKVDSLNASVLLPDGYDEQPGKAWPVLYLLHGGGDNHATWVRDIKLDILKTAAGFPGIIVMPEGGRGNFIDWWQRGARNGPRWTRYYLDEVFPTIEARYRVLPGRQNHAIGGLSMGAYGAMFLGGQLPGYFGTILSMSGLLDTQTPANVIATQLATGQPITAMTGPMFGSYATAHNPIRTIRNVEFTRMYISTGNGAANLRLPYDGNTLTIGAILEARMMISALQYAIAAPIAGARPTIRFRGGVHDWPYWKLELPKAIAWNLFARPRIASSAEATRWQYTTMEPAGNAWGIGYRFSAPPIKIAYLARSGSTLTGTGEGTVTINPGAADTDASGAGTRPDCSFTTKLPFSRTLPAGC